MNTVPTDITIYTKFLFFIYWEDVSSNFPRILRVAVSVDFYQPYLSDLH